jgi:hypothetical protein
MSVRDGRRGLTAEGVRIHWRRAAVRRVFVGHW